MPRVTVKDVVEMSIEERIRLIEDIWDSIAESSESIRLTVAQELELDRRLDANRCVPGRGDSWVDVRRRVESQTGS